MRPALRSDPYTCFVSDEQAVGPEQAERERIEEELLQRREAALAQVVKFGDPVLKSRASEVAEFGPELRAEVERMIGIMRDGLGVGLAATQVGILGGCWSSRPAASPSRRLWSIRPSSGCPTMSWSPRRDASACPGVAMDVERALHARLTGLDVDGEPVTLEASGLEARILQHEIDHLDGVLILDRAPRDQRKAALRALREGGSYSPSGEEGDEEEQTSSHREPRTDA